MISRKCAAIVTFGVVMLFVSLASGDRYLATLGSTPLIFVGTAYMMYAKSRVKVRRTVSSEGVFEGESLRVNLEVENRSSGFHIIEVFDELPKYFELNEGKNHAFFALRKGERGELSYTVRCPLRGRYLIGPVTVRAYDFFTLFYENYSMDIATEVGVYPHAEDIREVGLKTLYRKMPVGPATLRLPGSGKEFHDIREYQPTDPLKHINWKVYARKRELMVNEYEKDDIYDTYITLDARAIAGAGRVKSNPLEYEIKAMLGVVEALIKEGNRVSIGVHGRGIKLLRPGFGSGRYRAILEFSSEILAEGNTGVKALLDAFSHHMSPKSPVIMFHTLLGDTGVEDTCRYLLSKGHSIILITPTASELYGGKQTVNPRIMALLHHRKMLIKTLMRMGVMVVSWNPKKPLREILIKKMLKGGGPYAS